MVRTCSFARERVLRCTLLVGLSAGCASITTPSQDAGRARSTPDAGARKKKPADGGRADAAPLDAEAADADKSQASVGMLSDASPDAAEARGSVPGTGGSTGGCASATGCTQPPSGPIDKVDLLFMIDDSDSMAAKQDAVRSQVGLLLKVLTSGDLDGDGKADQPAVTDLHLGVVTSDMGLPGVQGIQNCQRLGRDGLLQHMPPISSQCTGSYPSFVAFASGSDLVRAAQDFGCISVVGTGGCGFEASLEAALKALWPSVDPGAPGGSNRITFLVDPVSGNGATGHGGPGDENGGFLRNGAASGGPSLIVVVEVSDEDDCSMSDTRPFTPPQYLDPNDPVAMEGMNVRCYYNKNALYPIERYVNGLKALRPSDERLVLFSAIVGVPPDLVTPEQLAKVDFDDAAQRGAFYDGLLKDMRMQEVVQTQGSPDPSDDRLGHSCSLGSSPADPPIRFVKTAAGFGASGSVHSICEQDLSATIRDLAGRIGQRLGSHPSR